MQYRNKNNFLTKKKSFKHVCSACSMASILYHVAKLCLTYTPTLFLSSLSLSFYFFIFTFLFPS